jgi:hypothetical protein
MQSNPYLPQFSYLVPSAICRHKTFHHTSHTTWSCRDVTTKIAQTLKSNLCWLTMPHKGLGAVDSPAPSVLGWVNGRRSAPLISNNAWHPLWRPIRRNKRGRNISILYDYSNESEFFFHDCHYELFPSLLQQISKSQTILRKVGTYFECWKMCCGGALKKHTGDRA